MRYKEAGVFAPTYALGRAFMNAKASLPYDIKLKGQENIPSSGPVLIGPSHRNAEDPWILGLTSNRPVFCMAKKELWSAKYAYLGYYALSLVGAFPVDRENPGHSTIRTARDHLKRGRVVGIFGEASRYEDEERKQIRGRIIGKIHRSIGLLSVLENAPISPMGIGLARGANTWVNSKIVRVSIAPPLIPDQTLGKKDAEEKIMTEFYDSLQNVFTEASEAAASEAAYS